MAAAKQERNPEMDNDALRWDRVCRRLRAEIGAQQLAAARQVHKAAVLRWLVRRDQVAAAALCRAIEIEHRCRQRVARALIQHSRPSTR